MIKHDITKLKKAGLNVDEMLAKLEGKHGDILRDTYENYEPNDDIIKRLEDIVNCHTFVVFSADWCKDCKKYVAEFAKIVKKKPSINAIFFKSIKSAPLDPDVRWRIPPSPPEVDEFDLRKIPTFYILNSSGEQVGEMIENPKSKPTLAEELLFILENLQG